MKYFDVSAFDEFMPVISRNTLKSLSKDRRLFLSALWMQADEVLPVFDKLLTDLRNHYVKSGGDKNKWIKYVIAGLKETEEINYNKRHIIISRLQEEIGSITLEEMFINVSDLYRITQKLKEHSFVNKEGQWVGKASPGKPKIPKVKQLAALALVIQEKDFLVRKQYQAKELHKAFNTYFHIKTANNYFKPTVIEEEGVEEYKSLFSFI